MFKEGLLRELAETEDYFNRSTACLTEEHSSYKPQDDMMTVAQQIAHVGITVEWFLEGAFSGNGFNMDFESHVESFLRYESVDEARTCVQSAFAAAREAISSRSEEELHAPLQEGPVMGGLPSFTIVGGIAEHTAHHRGALTVYSRMIGLVPAMPYMDE